MLAMEMKSAGMYVSRGLSFRQTEVRDVYLCSTSTVSFLFFLDKSKSIQSENFSTAVMLFSNILR